MKQILIALILLSIVATAYSRKLSQARTAEVEQKQGVYIFYKGQKPTDQYDFVGAVETGVLIKNYKPEYLVSLLLKKTKDKFPSADGIMFTDENNIKAEAIKFK